MSTSKKRSIIMAEGMRRLRNCSSDLTCHKKAYLLNRFSSDMGYSGHTDSFRMTILQRVVARCEVELFNLLEGKVRLYRRTGPLINQKTNFNFLYI